MNWSTIKRELKPSVTDFKNHRKNDVQLDTKDNIMNINNKTCMFCGGIYKGFMYCYKDFNNDDLDIILACKLCYMIRHMNHNNSELDIYHSNLSQSDIVKSIVNHIVNYNSIPGATKIDPSAKPTNISLLEYIIFLNNDKYYDVVKDIKVFVKPNFNYNYLSTTIHMFISDDESDSD